MNSTTQSLLHFLQSHHETMIEQLHQFCNINTGTENTTGLLAMRSLLETTFTPIADHIQIQAFPSIPIIDMTGTTHHQKYGEALLIRKRPHLQKRVLLCGHMDTVYSANHPFQQLTYLDDNCLNGPGVADMKGGLIVMLYALMAFETLPQAASLGWDVIITADEEVGSPVSGPWLAEVSQHYQVGLVYEPAMDKLGTLAKNRKGSGKLTLIAHGKTAHAGRDFDAGRNAIYKLAEALVDVQHLNGQRQGVTINIGLIGGGTALNMVPDQALAKLDIRISQPEDEHWIRQQLAEIIKKHTESGFSFNLQGHFGRPVKHINKVTTALFHRIQTVGELLELKLDWKDSGGCCDGNNLAHQGLPVIDTLGVRGGHLHTSDEFILLDSMVERAALSALLLLDLAQERSHYDHDVIP